jgi:hypothetical protein
MLTGTVSVEQCEKCLCKISKENSQEVIIPNREVICAVKNE